LFIGIYVFVAVPDEKWLELIIFAQKPELSSIS
jgi:hypothetical protein